MPILNYLYNLICGDSQHISSNDVDLIKNTNLFDHVSDQQLHDIIESARLIKCKNGKLIFKEGDVSDFLYIIKEGAVDVFTRDVSGQKILLARLKSGDYFGEQALIDRANKTRNANIEATKPTTLIKLSAKSIVPLWQQNEMLRKKLIKIGYREAINILTSTVKFYNEIHPLIEQDESGNQCVIEYQKGETIFNYGDQPDNVYFILQGEINLLIPDKKSTDNRSITLHKGNLFGESAVIENKPRQATAIVGNHSRLLVINGNYFKKIYHRDPQLQRLLAELKRTYQLPLRGVVKQYMGNSDSVGSTITTIYKMDNDRSIIAVRSLSENIFTMSVVDAIPDKEYQYSEDKFNFIKLLMLKNSLIRIEVFGEWDDLGVACQLLLDEVNINQSLLDKFTISGEITKKDGGIKTDIICSCMSVTRSRLQELIDKGNRDVESLSMETGASLVCGSCKHKIMEMIGGSPWLSAIMSKVIIHNDSIASYQIKPIYNKINLYLPGQYITLQAKVRGNWVERNYTITSLYQDDQDALRITIKKEKDGIFTQWLFNESPEQIVVNITQPKGNFVLNIDSSNDVLCFAGGVGIAPFLSFAKYLAEAQNKKRTHIFYCALSEGDFIFKDEFNDIINTINTITIDYKITMIEGLLTSDDIVKLAKSFSDPDIYICGPGKFNDLICHTLSGMNYDKNKVHVEQFIKID